MKVVVNGKSYEHITTEITRKAKIEYSNNTGLTLAGTLSLDPLGTRLIYKLTFDSVFKDQEALENLWNDLIQPRRDGISITMPYNKTEVSFNAKIEDVEQGYKTTANGQRIWDKITVSFESTDLFIEVL